MSSLHSQLLGLKYGGQDVPVGCWGSAGGKSFGNHNIYFFFMIYFLLFLYCSFWENAKQLAGITNYLLRNSREPGELFFEPILKSKVGQKLRWSNYIDYPHRKKYNCQEIFAFYHKRKKKERKKAIREIGNINFTKASLHRFSQTGCRILPFSVKQLRWLVAKPISDGATQVTILNHHSRSQYFDLVCLYSVQWSDRHRLKFIDYLNMRSAGLWNVWQQDLSSKQEVKNR